MGCSFYQFRMNWRLPMPRIEKQMKGEEAEEWIRGGIIGGGASATVSLGITKSNAHVFAVKSSISSLENEYNILKSLDSPYIVQCLGKDYSGVGVYNLFLEYMPGGSIADLLTKFGGQLDESVIRSYTRDILLGIQYLHSQGIVHCDIKGKNVLVGSMGVKLADLGSAKRIGTSDDDKEERWQLRGTPLWMAPEVVKQVEQETASDIWSLGCTVVEMATGRPPWGSNLHPLTAMYRIGFTEELPDMPQSISPQAQDFVEKCLRRDPRQRWTSEQLLAHPFLSKEGSPVLKEGLLKGPHPQISPLDLGKWNSYSSSTDSCGVPVMVLPMNVPIVRQTQLGTFEGEEKKGDQKSPSPRDRILRLAARGEFKRSVEKVNNCAGPCGDQWIVVRSPKHKSLDYGPFQELSNGFFSEDIPSVQAEIVDCNPITECGDCAEENSESQGLSCRSQLLNKLNVYFVKVNMPINCIRISSRAWILVTLALGT